MRAELIAKHVPEPLFKKRPVSLSGTSGTYSGGAPAFVAKEKATILKPKSRPYWK
jgi:hypothetical protein